MLPEDEHNSGDSTAEDHENLSVIQIHERVKQFVIKLIPNADLIRDFNGSFYYLIPVGDGRSFNASNIY